MRNITIQIQSVLYNNNLSDLERSIASLARAHELYKCDHINTEPFVLRYGDASNVRIISDGELENLKEKYKSHLRIEYEFFACNTGTAKGHNILAKDCTSKYMMIINPDIIVCPRFYFEILEPFDIPELNTGLVEARQVPIEHPKDYNIKTGETSWATTACAVFTTEIFNTLNGFDAASFFMYCDDLDFSWRIRLLGKKIIYQPLALVFHAKRLTAQASWVPTPSEIYYSAVAAMMMAHKWSNPKLMNKLASAFSASHDETYRKAVQEFLQLRSDHKLPEPIDPEHKVATFVGDYYTKHRFVL